MEDLVQAKEQANLLQEPERSRALLSIASSYLTLGAINEAFETIGDMNEGYIKGGQMMGDLAKDPKMTETYFNILTSLYDEGFISEIEQEIARDDA